MDEPSERCVESICCVAALYSRCKSGVSVWTVCGGENCAAEYITHIQLW